MTYVTATDALTFVRSLEDASVDLLLTDPPYSGIVSDRWDNQWQTDDAYAAWMFEILQAAKPKLKPNGSVIFFGGLGKHGDRPFFKLMMRIEANNLFHYRNMITWSKRRAYGKSHDYLFTREELLWYSNSPERTGVTFNIPLSSEKRGYAGYNSKYPAKSEFKRITNVWTDITELFRPERVAQKPLPLMERLVATHSNPGDLVVDPFSGYGSTGIAALKLGRRFLGSELIPEDAVKANGRCVDILNNP